eukprot:CAMPEP_0118707762 /NCGR_PEP_ID=MMETSP0800-20121206/21424_1 /TAXON_ID=210618 ORGANISM="Striatella unipunctata, Strain CCMP2910" /NCGR_SAMPLE_ID=MMETSP0800 /ASSEMBLY_ACC=CAM_ASM_000638 /LENGTH=202 /DNA_ID=CAMNT_0006610705 /DNA_START=42 /DNA_END=647 /DNA_ORIENTATION=-
MNYLPSSKLKKYPIHFHGIKSQGLFTKWCWNLHLFFSTMAIATALVVFEIAAPSAMLVSAVVAHGIWPQLLKKGDDTAHLKRPVSLLQHNLNTVFALTETALLGAIRVRPTDFVVAPLFGITYLLFAWSMTHNWAPKEEGPQFPYFFLDTTMGWITTLSLLILLLVLLMFFGIFCLAEFVLTEVLPTDSYALFWHVAFVIVT